jgi:alpha-beta hydrolase superfamily lysophospholipase
MRPLAEALADEGYTVELPLWPGHGTAIEDMIPTRWADYAAAAEAAYRELARRCDETSGERVALDETRRAAQHAHEHPPDYEIAFAAQLPRE